VVVAIVWVTVSWLPTWLTNGLMTTLDLGLHGKSFPCKTSFQFTFPQFPPLRGSTPFLKPACATFELFL
jgi:hypothetical protein